MGINVNFTLDGVGMARCSVTSENVHCEITASDLSDALGDLLLAATAALSGFHSISFGFDEEPGEYRWIIETISAQRLKVQILEFPQLWGLRPNSEGKVLFQAEVDSLEFGRAVQAAATNVLATHGVDGYAKLWMLCPFPSEHLRVLTNSIDRAVHAA